VTQQIQRLIPQHGDPVLGDPPQLAMSDSVAHFGDPRSWQLAVRGWQ